MAGYGEEGGHIFAECWINDTWYQIDSTFGRIYLKPMYKPYIIYKIGLDSWDIGIRSYSDWQKAMQNFMRILK